MASDADSDDSKEPTLEIEHVEVKALDRTRLLRDVANSMADERINILACDTRTGSDRVTTMRFDFELGDGAHLDDVLATIREIDSVYDAYRVIQGKN